MEGNAVELLELAVWVGEVVVVVVVVGEEEEQGELLCGRWFGLASLLLLYAWLERIEDIAACGGLEVLMGDNGGGGCEGKCFVGMRPTLVSIGGRIGFAERGDGVEGGGVWW